MTPTHATLALRTSSLLLILSAIHPSVLATCSGTMTFTVTFEYAWTKLLDPEIPTTDPTQIEFVGFSPLRCATHSPKYTMWRKGHAASSALKPFFNVTHFSADKLMDEISSEEPNIFDSVELDSRAEPDESQSVSLKVRGDSNFTLISCIARIIPSPGWFVGLSSFQTCLPQDPDNPEGDKNFIDTTEEGLIGWNSGMYVDTDYAATTLTPYERPILISQLLGKIDKFGEANITNTDFKPESSSDHMSSCFPAGELITLADGSRLAVEHISTSHVVASRDARTASPIFMHSHADPVAISRFVHIHFRDGDEASSLRVSPGHYVYRVLASTGQLELVVASAITVGDELIGADRCPKPVYNVSWVTAKGLFNPHSLDGDLIVSGVRVSSFTNAVHPNVATSALVPLRLFHRLGVTWLQHVFSNRVLTGRWNNLLSNLLPGGQ